MFPIDLIRRQKKTYKKVLSLDGGGVRGLASVIFLKELEKSVGKTVFGLFENLLLQLIRGEASVCP